MTQVFQSIIVIYTNSSYLHTHANQILSNEYTGNPPEIIIEEKGKSDHCRRYIDRQKTDAEISKHFVRPFLKIILTERDKLASIPKRK